MAIFKKYKIKKETKIACNTILEQIKQGAKIQNNSIRLILWKMWCEECARSYMYLSLPGCHIYEISEEERNVIYDKVEVMSEKELLDEIVWRKINKGRNFTHNIFVKDYEVNEEVFFMRQEIRDNVELMGFFVEDSES